MLSGLGLWWEFSYKFNVTTSNQFAQIVYFFLTQSSRLYVSQNFHFSRLSNLLVYNFTVFAYDFFYISERLIFIASPQDMTELLDNKHTNEFHTKRALQVQFAYKSSKISLVLNTISYVVWYF